MEIYSKRQQILDAMQDLMMEQSSQFISVSDIAKKAGIGKGSIYYYFKSKEDILQAVIERSYRSVIEKGKELVSTSTLDTLTKMKIIFDTCRETSMEFHRQECNTYFQLQQRALLREQFMQILIHSLMPILSDIIKQGNEEGVLHCEAPESTAEIVLLVLTVKLENPTLSSSGEGNQECLDAFCTMLEKSMQIETGKLSFLRDSSS